MEEIDRFRFRGSNCELSAVDLGNYDAPDMILVHGMRDHALSLTSIGLEFAKDFHVLMPDLRGHGDSENPGSYSMMQFVADLRALVLEKELKNPIIIGHSLGGHISSKYAAIYTEEVRSLVLLDGMGPPRPEETLSDKQHRLHLNQSVDTLLSLSGQRKPIANKEEALDRLIGNNPLLSHETARLIVDHGVEPHPAGGVRWKWDPSVNMVWNTFSHDESESQWSWINCPTLIVTGDNAMEYWATLRQELHNQQQLHIRDLVRRTKIFSKGKSVTIPNAGHMIHYDQPELLNQHLREFITSLPGQVAPN